MDSTRQKLQIDDEASMDNVSVFLLPKMLIFFSYSVLKTFAVVIMGNASIKNCHLDILLTNHSEKCIQIIFLTTKCDLAGTQWKYLLIPRSTTPYEPLHKISNNVVCATSKG